MISFKLSQANFSLLSSIYLLTCLCSVTGTVYAQETASTELQTVSPNDFGQWERINRGTSFSNNGTWLQYSTITNAKDKSLFIINTKTKKTQKFNNAERPRFSADNKWLVYAKVLTGMAAKKLKQSKSKKKAPNKMGVINLVTNDTLEFIDVVNYKFSGSGAYLAMKREKDKVNTLIVKNLDTGLEVTFGNIKDYAWQDQGTLLAMVINTNDKVGNAIQLYNPLTGNLKVLDQEKETYSGLQWRKESADLLALRTSKDTLFKDDSHSVLVWKTLSSQYVKKEFNQKEYSNFPNNSKLINSGISFSDDGKSVLFRTEFREAKPKKKTKENKQSKETNNDDEAAEVEIWNSKDVDIIPSQKKNSRFGSKLAAWNVETNTFYELENALIDRVRLQTDTDLSIGQDQTPYEFEVMFGRPSYDLYAVNTKSGGQQKTVTAVNRYWTISPNNQYFVFLKEDNLHIYNLKTKGSQNITQNLDGRFIDIDNDHPTPQKPAFGFAGWSTDSKSYFINSEFDVWQIFTDGASSIRVTNGKSDGVIYRYQNFDRDQKHIDMSAPVYFRMFGKTTKKSGLALGKPGNKIKTLIYKDASVSGITKAKDSKDMVFTEQTYSQSPNLFLTNITFKSPAQVSNTNEFQKEHRWGKAELISYTNVLGKEAQGILYYPANYEKGKKYPMITYIYEKLSNRLHNYIAPSRTSYYNTTVWSQNGYFVLNPDIEFIAGDPGVSSAKNLESVVKKVLDMGDVDAKRVGLIGHSWGGYQAGYVPTQTDIFAASVAGAGLTELISMNLAVTPAFGGTPENAHFEVSQERMEVAPWKAPESYLRNSSVMNIEKLNTPILFEVGDNDQNVNWFQGIAYYNAARRAAKPFVLLVYAKEGHGLRQDKNRIDYQQRILTWFGHYLKGEQAEDWMTEGVTYAEQQRRLNAKAKTSKD